MNLDDITDEMIDSADGAELDVIRRTIHEWICEQSRVETSANRRETTLVAMYARAKNANEDKATQTTIIMLENEYALTGDVKWLQMADELDGGIAWQ